MFAKHVLKAAHKSLHLTETTWRGSQPAWLLQCEKLELILTKHGLNIASVTHRDDANKFNPYWVPKWPWKSPTECPHLRIKGPDAEMYGNREDSQLLTNICGHSLCIDRFGICKLTDEPRTCHGEAPVTEWDVHFCDNDTVQFSVFLPLAKLYLRRSFDFEDDTVYITTWVDNASNRFHDFFQSEKDPNDPEEESVRDRNQRKLNTFTMQQMTEDMNKELQRSAGPLHAERTPIGSSSNNNALSSSNASMNMDASSFMNLPKNKRARQAAKERRDSSNLARTYGIVRSFMEDEYRAQIVESKGKAVKEFVTSPRKFLEKWKNRSSSYSELLEHDPNQNEALNDKLIQQQFDKQHETYREPKDLDLSLQFEQDDRTRYDVEWCEHIAIGDAFLDDAQFILPSQVMADNVAIHCPLEMNESRFKGQKEIALDQCLQIPKSEEKEMQIAEAAACFVDDDADDNDNGEKEMNEKSFIVRNERIGFELEYEWNSKTWPWLCIWTEHYGTAHVPWNNGERVRGLELSTKPFPIPSLEKELPSEEISKHEKDEKIHLWNGKRIDIKIPEDGKVETFALRWSPIASK